jgi:outer membrane cobalamin receptor
MVSSMAGYQIYGTSGSYKLSGRFELQARVDNLTDKDYQTQIGFDGPGRSYRIGLRYR